MGGLDRVFRGRRAGFQLRPLAAIVAGLWRNNEQGVEYDIPGFRDSWENVGPEQLTNGNFDTGLSGWSSIQPAGSSITAAGGSVAFTSDGASYAAFTQGNVFEIGKIYIVTLEGVSGTGSLKAVGVDTEVIFTTSRTIVGRATASSFSIARVAGVAASMSIGGVSVREWLGVTTCSLFQDAAGTLPAYMPGQGQVDPPVGLLLDKRLGLRRGENVWQDSSVTLTGQASRVSAGVYRYTPDGSISAVNHPVTAGRWYAVSFRVAAVAVASVGLYIGPSVANPVFASAYMVAGQTVSAVVCATGSVLSIARNASTTDVTIDSVVFRELKGNHAYQTTTTSRPTLSARYNGFVASEKFDDPYWTWQASFSSSKTSEIADPDGGSNAWKITSTNNNAVLSRAGVTGFKNPVFTLVCRPGTWNPSILVRNGTTATNLIQGTYGSADSTGTYGKFRTVDLGNGWKQMQIEITSGAATTDSLVCYLGSTGAVPVGQYLYLYRADIREAGDGVGLPPYQRVVDANTYDTYGFPLYLRFDGVDDWLRTADIDFTGTTSLIFAAAARKLSDAARGTLFELSSSYSNPGAFAMEAPGITLNSFMVAHTGATTYKTLYRQLAAPVSAVVVAESNLATGYLKLSGDSAGYSQSIDTITDVGGGTYANAALFIGRRAGSSQPFSGRLYGLIIRGGVSSPAQVAAVRKHLNIKARIY